MKKPLLFAGVAAALILYGMAALAYKQPAQGQAGTATTTSSFVPPAQPSRTVSLDGQTIRVMIADTEASREQGLGGLPGLAPDEGMLFIFPQDGVYAFWMKDMRFSIDMVWLSSSGKVIYIAQNISPNTFPKDFGPHSPARYVLELPANYTKEYNVSIGDIVRL